jgi:hypothetical protein
MTRAKTPRRKGKKVLVSQTDFLTPFGHGVLDRNGIHWFTTDPSSVQSDSSVFHMARSLRRIRHPDRPGVARPQQRQDDADLHTRSQPWRPWRLQSSKPEDDVVIDLELRK